jgi:hypothetical protein
VHGLGQASEALCPLVAASAVEAHLAAILDDLEAIPVELRLIHLGIA